MWSFIENTLPNFFADDLACVISGMMGAKYTQQCLDLERKLHKLFEYLEYYSVLSVQPINHAKTEIMWTARAIGNPKFEVKMGEHKIAWVKSFRYLGYHISNKLGWNTMITTYKNKIRQRVALIRTCKMYGTSSEKFRRMLFSVFVLPLFTWILSIFPLFTECQREDLNKFYYTCLKRVVGVPYWNNFLFAILYDERSLDNLCHRYWTRYRKALDKTIDGSLLYEQLAHNTFREQWIDKHYVVKYMYRSKRIIPHVTTIQRCLAWMENSTESSIPLINAEEMELLTEFPISFM